ncbi:permease-like cell division protein FtsX [Shouchella sp. JSM 1781072]|uniref:permease-like cell division protein FtsX n=1 Tax=Bacillaceae TaxID=186817 RepID=UPI000C07181A|nr:MULTISPECIES: permease-like cell division protein FtsX [Bacillaceae]UTR05595.1 permease-like cell division protein FtsX [Alkalihalobacillus sp. LMS6]
MKFNAAKRHIREGFKNIGRSGWMTFASISAVTVMLVIVGFFMIVFLNGNHIASTIEDNVEIRAFIERGTDEAEINDLIEEVNEEYDVAQVEFIDKEEGLENLIASTDGEDYWGSLREDNPLRDALRIIASTPQLTEEIAQSVDEHPYIGRVSYGEEIISDLFTITNTGRVAGAVVVAALLFTAMFLISNTIKLTILARKNEIQIMKLVGAKNSFVRWPFLIEGMLLGILGSIVPILLISFGYTYLYNQSASFLQSVPYDLLAPNLLILQLSILLVVVGLGVGIWGSVMSVRKFLKV